MIDESLSKPKIAAEPEERDELCQLVGSTDTRELKRKIADDDRAVDYEKYL